MKKLFVPFLCNKETFVDGRNGPKLLPPCERALEAFSTEEAAIEAGQQMSLMDPKGKVVVFESTIVIEPKKVEFVQKRYNGKGELLV
jgi:hypothetical protein